MTVLFWYDYQESSCAQSIYFQLTSYCFFLAADSAKFGRNAVVRLGNIQQKLDRLFTDEPTTKSHRLTRWKETPKYGLELLYAQVTLAQHYQLN